MLCDHCRERDAMVHLTTIVNSEVTQQHLCEKCAAAKGIETTIAVPKHPLGDFLHAAQHPVSPAAGDQKRCAYCETTLRDFRASGRLGCAHCYTAFEGALRDLLRRVQGGAKHMGRDYTPPAVAGSEGDPVLEALRSRLQQAVVAEEFEAAAALRDQIRALE